MNTQVDVYIYIYKKNWNPYSFTKEQSINHISLAQKRLEAHFDLLRKHDIDHPLKVRQVYIA